MQSKETGKILSSEYIPVEVIKVVAQKQKKELMLEVHNA